MEITLVNNSEVKIQLSQIQNSIFRIGDLYFYQFKMTEVYEEAFESIQMLISTKSIITSNDVRFKHFDLFELKKGIVDINKIGRMSFLKSISSELEGFGCFLPSKVNKELGIKYYSSKEHKMKKLKELFLKNNSKNVYIGAGNQFENLVPLSKKRLASFLGFKIQEKMFFGVKESNPTHFYAR